MTSQIGAGADGIFAPGAADPMTVASLATAIDVPLNVLYLAGRHTFRELAAAGAARVSTGSLLFREALRSVVETAHEARSGSVPDDPPTRPCRRV